ncbi:hypothetical protein H257_03141 [Aphanomyces astaci]|uniref:Major facilitator superfamily (MFS) profile domain-containing protein n=1 Tax=Aphanomyces astaci TaxID=112090 RepID=W4H299_APHAT|nr:hypothetical protein H257_03141 [Aphanomyces astaci]ETV85384.1 hypothetical protein H257_03141 [Aphanomyces astaci]RQM30901.1 hypothetical protein B5M09_013291 [Aphanomyces astaci]|eukprot:XP_009825402.1 hypothetical protein H257_03141 [Aphanomyces astaci]
MFDGRVNRAEFFFQQILPLDMLLGSMITFKFADRLGRATMLELAAIPYVLGWLFVGVAFGQVMLLVCRYCLGVAMSVFSIVVPILLAELSEDDSRGRVLTTSQLIHMLRGRMVYTPVLRLLLRHNDRIMSFSVCLKIQSPASVNRSTRAKIRVNSIFAL